MVPCCCLFHLSSISFHIGRGEHVSLMYCSYFNLNLSLYPLDSRILLCITDVSFLHIPFYTCLFAPLTLASRYLKSLTFFDILTILKLVWVVAPNKTSSPKRFFLLMLRPTLLTVSNSSSVFLCIWSRSHTGPLNRLAAPSSST